MNFLQIYYTRRTKVAKYVLYKKSSEKNGLNEKWLAEMQIDIWSTCNSKGKKN